MLMSIICCFKYNWSTSIFWDMFLLS